MVFKIQIFQDIMNMTETFDYFKQNLSANNLSVCFVLKSKNVFFLSICNKKNRSLHKIFNVT